MEAPVEVTVEKLENGNVVLRQSDDGEPVELLLSPAQAGLIGPHLERMAGANEQPRTISANP